MPNISMNKDAHKFAPVMLNVRAACGGANGCELNHRWVLAAGGSNHQWSRPAYGGSAPFVTGAAINCISRAQGGAAHLAPVRCDSTSTGYDEGRTRESIDQR
jgi:hypothetical protein